jgi:hypothetical protein
VGRKDSNSNYETICTKKNKCAIICLRSSTSHCQVEGLGIFDLLSDSDNSVCLLTSLSIFRCSLAVRRPCSSQRTYAVELPDEVRESVEVIDTGLKGDSEERTEPDRRLRLKMLAVSTESRLATGATVEFHIST